MTALAGARTRSRTRWVQVDRGLYVANRRGDFVGYVAATPYGTYVVFDETSAAVGSYDTLLEAQRSFAAVAGEQSLLRPSLATAGFASLTVICVGLLAGGAFATFL